MSDDTVTVRRDDLAMYLGEDPQGIRAVQRIEAYNALRAALAAPASAELSGVLPDETGSSSRLPVPDEAALDLVAHLERQRAWSTETFGPGPRLGGVLDHLRKELAEVEAQPDDLSEWIDVVLLALDGAWRQGYEPSSIAAALAAKQARNEAREWPDWRTAPEGEAIEHVRAAPPVPDETAHTPQEPAGTFPENTGEGDHNGNPERGPDDVGAQPRPGGEPGRERPDQGRAGRGNRVGIRRPPEGVVVGPGVAVDPAHPAAAPVPSALDKQVLHNSSNPDEAADTVTTTLDEDVYEKAARRVRALNAATPPVPPDREAQTEALAKVLYRTRAEGTSHATRWMDYWQTLAAAALTWMEAQR